MNSRLNLIVLLLLVLSRIVTAQTPLPSVVEGRLTIDESPYLMESTVVVNEQTNLIIDPGVEILVAVGPVMPLFYVRGGFQAIGTPDSLIVFRAQNPDSVNQLSWGGLSFSLADTNAVPEYPQVMRFLEVRNAETGILFYRNNQIDHQSLVLDHCAIKYSQLGIYVNNFVNIEISNCNIGHCLGGIYSNNYSAFELDDLVVHNNIIYSSRYGFMLSSQDMNDQNDLQVDYNDFFDVDSAQYNRIYNSDAGAYFYFLGDSLENVFADPLFVGDSYEIFAESPCVDAGDPASPNDPDGTPADIGLRFFDQTEVYANFYHLEPDTIAVVGRAHTDQIIARGDPTPEVELLSGPEGMVFTPETFYLYWLPDSFDVGVHDVSFVARNIVEDVEYTDTLNYHLWALFNRPPLFTFRDPGAEDCEVHGAQQDTIICSGYYPGQEVSIEIQYNDAENDEVYLNWQVNGVDVPGSNPFRTSLLTYPDNWISAFITDSQDTTWTYWNLQVNVTELSGTVGSGSLSAEDSLIVIADHVYVPHGDTLKVFPGSSVYLLQENEDLELVVNGFLEIKSDINRSPVEFRPFNFDTDTTRIYWNGIRFAPNSSGGILDNVLIRNARRGIMSQFSDGIIWLNRAEFLNDSIAVQVHDTELNMSNCLIRNMNQYGVFAEGDAPVTITNTGFSNTRFPVYLYRADASLTNCTFASRLDVGFYYNFQLHPITSLRSRIELVNSVFFNYGTWNGLDLALYADEETEPVSIEYNMFYNDTTLVIGSYQAPFPPQVSNRSDLLSSTFLYANPKLSLEDSTLFELHPESPAIDAGDPTILDPDGSRSDLGMFGGPGAINWQQTGTWSAPVVPVNFEFNGIYPNPFNPVTHVDFSLPETGHTLVQIFNITGAKVRTLQDGPLASGRHVLRFDATGLASGIYLVRVRYQNAAHHQKMLFVK